jgi:hypothetical protein
MHRVYLAAMILLYFVFLVLDLFFPQAAALSDVLKWLSICLNFAGCAWTIRPYSLSDWRLTCTGLLLTVVCDFFLLFTTAYLWGVLLFILVQGQYLKRTGVHSVSFFYTAYIVLLAVSMFAEMTKIFDPLYVVSAFYAFALFTVWVRSLHAPLPQKNRRAFFGGMSLFLLCDVNVALTNLFSGDPFSSWFQFFMWFFYLPAQLLIAKSTEE